jgi:GH43 family beta-xylosidase
MISTVAKHALAGVIGLGLIAAPAAHAAKAKPTFTNPLLTSGADPWITRQGDTYFYMNTLGNRLAIRKTTDLTRLAEAAEITIWTPPATGPNAQSIWAPELHRIGNAWYIYYTAAASGHDDDAHRGIFVLENTGPDPTVGAWTERGRLNTAHSGIDGTTFSYGGKRYFVYSPYVGPDSELAIATMADPWTLVGPEVIIARPDRDWERRGGRQILEGPEFLAGPKGDLFLTYSASACWSDDYAIGVLHAAAGSDPLDPAGWIKTAQPVIAKAPAQNVYAPGHNGFFTTLGERQTWIVYHANPGPGLKCTSQRSPRIQRVKWSKTGTPLFARPVGSGVPVEAPAAR